MDSSVRAQVDRYLPHLAHLIRDGQRLKHTLATEAPAPAAMRVWQRECAAAVSQLSGGSKAHWLSRAYSRALLVRSSEGRAVEEADLAEIVDRIVDVLEQAVASLRQWGDQFPQPRDQLPQSRFEFVHHRDLRPVLAQAYEDGREALERGDARLALTLFCSAIEAIIADALEHCGSRIADCGFGSEAESAIGEAQSAIRNPQSAMTFTARIALAERAGLIRGGCARLPQVARNYRDLTDEDGELRGTPSVSARDARLAGQVLHVVMRDLDPGR